MPNYSELIADIAAAIYPNSQQEIDAVELRAILTEMVQSLGAGFSFQGVANPAVNPGTPDNNVIYLAGPGTYNYYGALVVPAKSLGILKYDGSWALETISAEDIATFLQVNEDGWHLVDEQMNVALKYDADGLDAAKVSDHFKSLLGGGGGSGDFIQVAEDGLYFVDAAMNIGAYIDEDGVHAPNIGEGLEYDIIS